MIKYLSMEYGYLCHSGEFSESEAFKVSQLLNIIGPKTEMGQALIWVMNRAALFEKGLQIVQRTETASALLRADMQNLLEETQKEI